MVIGMAQEETFFDFAAYVGLTKHLGGRAATEQLAELCHLNEGKVLLDVGCGVGVTACYLAREYGCHVVGVDISEAMVAQSRARARREGVDKLVTFEVADAQALPFEDGQFDAVITESVTSFPEDKQKAVNEYVRVTKAGGYIGLNESTWLKFPPPDELVSWVSQDVGANAKPLSKDEWVGLLKTAGLTDVFVNIHEIDIREETKSIFSLYGVFGMLRIWSRMLVLYFRNPAYRQFLKSVRKQGIAPKNINEFFGYGIYVGKKLP
jgi:arsenite methyltransferase